MSGLAPRAREDSVRPRRSSGVVVRPLNFTVRWQQDALAAISPAATLCVGSSSGAAGNTRT